MERLSKVKESLLSLVQHLEAGTLRSAPAISSLEKDTKEELLSKIEATGSNKDKMGDREATPTAAFTLANREMLP